ncbi:hypothetical protein AQ802_29550 [Burkholderia pseudomallei]|uniref:Uncharacterized protein n=1 Tax=Burkholderia pseudomallei 1710a TaxID=320371 RepID=A0A0E1VXS6_BURPE|nr:hypothetical protein AMS56_23470 [Burkholderia pseudomallei]EET05760.1 hypothetical protein BURPS1710A_A1919 [Burkholderia pseudomallei 1710a]OMQ48765.1 hypothetical protein AQ708_13285 [Burkholderia pseudomallei]OMQ61584.1 hypothetical protein AQ710_17455 [Burkholderia pseudomallei]OMQ85626.1 hypothetical protein AQ715_07660 [Burkholderia pseudomallei]
MKPGASKRRRGGAAVRRAACRIACSNRAPLRMPLRMRFRRGRADRQRNRASRRARLTHVNAGRRA